MCDQFFRPELRLISLFTHQTPHIVEEMGLLYRFALQKLRNDTLSKYQNFDFFRFSRVYVQLDKGLQQKPKTLHSSKAQDNIEIGKNKPFKLIFEEFDIHSFQPPTRSNEAHIVVEKLRILNVLLCVVRVNMLSNDPEYILMSSELLPHDNIALCKFRSNHTVHESIQAGEGDLLPVLAHNLKLVNQPGEISFM